MEWIPTLMILAAVILAVIAAASIVAGLSFSFGAAVGGIFGVYAALTIAEMVDQGTGIGVFQEEDDSGSP